MYKIAIVLCLSLILGAVAQNPCVRFVNALTPSRIESTTTSGNSTTAETISIANWEVWGEYLAPGQTIQTIQPSIPFHTVQSSYTVVPIGSRVWFSWQTTSGVFQNSTIFDDRGSFVLNEDKFYTVVIRGWGDFNLDLIEDDLDFTGLYSRVSVANYASRKTNFILSGRYSNGTLIPIEEMNRYPSPIGNGSPLNRFESVKDVEFRTTTATYVWSEGEAVGPIGVDTLAFFWGKAYTIWFFGDYDLSVRGTQDYVRVTVTKDSDVGILIPTEKRPTPVDMCEGVECEPPRQCRAGRCILPTSDDLCRNYLGFDLVEAAREFLIEIWGDMQIEFQEIISRLKEMNEALLEYDPTTGDLSLDNYVWALSSLCSGRHEVKCSEIQCAPPLYATPDSTCSEQECQVPLRCAGLSEIQFLQQVYLSAVAKLTANRGWDMDQCLSEYAGGDLRLPPVRREEISA